MVVTRNSAECTALRAATMPIPQTTAIGARMKNAACSPPFTAPAPPAASW